MNSVDPLAWLTRTLGRIADRWPISQSTSSCPGTTAPERLQLRAYVDSEFVEFITQLVLACREREFGLPFYVTMVAQNGFSSVLRIHADGDEVRNTRWAAHQSDDIVPLPVMFAAMDPVSTKWMVGRLGPDGPPEVVS